MATYMDLNAADVKTPGNAIPPLAPDARTSDRRVVQELIDLEFTRYQEMRDEVRKQLAQLRRSVAAKNPN